LRNTSLRLLVYDDLESRLGIRIQRMLASELLLRAQASTTLLPGGNWEAMPEALARLLDQLQKIR
jgi:hypothetical protein